MNQIRVAPNLRPHEPPFVLLHGDKAVDVVFEFLQNLHMRGVAARTIRAYTFDLLCFYRFLSRESLTLDTLTHRHFTAFILAQRKSNSAPRTINRRLTAVRGLLNSLSGAHGDKIFSQTMPTFYKGARNKALLGATRLKGKTKAFHVKVPSVLITPLTQSEIKKFFLGIRKYRDTAIVTLMIFCGLRSCEVLSLSVNDIDLIDDRIRVRGKGGKERNLPMSASVRQSIQRYLDYERPEVSHDRLFVVLKGAHRGQALTAGGLRTLFRHRRKILNLDAANPHKFRHTFCTNMIRQGVSLAVVQKLMGHADIEVTMGYVHLSIDDVAREYHQAVTKLQS
jgi:site-specific recombinase XerD